MTPCIVLTCQDHMLKRGCYAQRAKHSKCRLSKPHRPAGLQDCPPAGGVPKGTVFGHATGFWRFGFRQRGCVCSVHLQRTGPRTRVPCTHGRDLAGHGRAGERVRSCWVEGCCCRRVEECFCCCCCCCIVAHLGIAPEAPMPLLTRTACLLKDTSRAGVWGEQPVALSWVLPCLPSALDEDLACYQPCHLMPCRSMAASYLPTCFPSAVLREPWQPCCPSAASSCSGIETT